METLTSGALPCFACGLVDLPRKEPGTGPHAWKALCSGCGHFLKWLGKSTEERMQASVNRVTLLGTVSDRGVEVGLVGERGTPRASFMIVVNETGQDGKSFVTYVPCEIWGKRAESAGHVDAGQLVLFEGRLRKRQKPDQSWEMVVSGFDLMPVSVPAST